MIYRHVVRLSGNEPPTDLARKVVDVFCRGGGG